MSTTKSRYELKDGHRFAPSKSEEYFSLSVKHTQNGFCGLFSNERIPKGSVVIRDGGQVVTSVADIPADKCYAVLIGENLFLAPHDYNKLENPWYMNHSCEPNTMRIGGLIYTAVRDILPGEELSIDYASLISGVPNWQLKCLCGSKNCRNTISSDDWQNREIADRLWPEWLPFIQNRIISMGILKND